MSQNVHGTVLKFPPSLPPTTRVFLAQIFGNVVLTCVFCTRGVRTHACGHDAAGGYFLKKKTLFPLSPLYRSGRRPSSHRSIASHSFVLIVVVGAITFAANIVAARRR